MIEASKTMRFKKVTMQEIVAAFGREIPLVPCFATSSSLFVSLSQYWAFQVLEEDAYGEWIWKFVDFFPPDIEEVIELRDKPKLPNGGGESYFPDMPEEPIHHI